MNNLLKDFNKKIVFVTGGAGFIGSHLCEQLVNLGAVVFAYDVVPSSKANNLLSVIDKINYISGDICNYDSVASALKQINPDYVLHLAANASVPKSSEDPIYDFEQNAKGTTVILEAIRQFCKKTKVVLTSSGAVYGDPGTEAIKESDPLRPISPYGSSKYMSEIQMDLYHRTFNINGSVARLFNCYGPRLPRFVVLDFLNKLEKNPESLEILGTGRQTRDFTYVSDTVSGILHVASKGAAGQAYNIASGESHNVLELAKIILDLRQLKNTIIKTSGESWQGDAQFWKVNISKAKSIGYMPKVDLISGLKLVIEWYEQEQK